MANTTVKVGGDALVTLAWPKGYRLDGREVAARVERIEGDTVFVRLVGLVPQPYDAGMYLALDADKVRPMGGW